MGATTNHSMMRSKQVQKAQIIYINKWPQVTCSMAFSQPGFSFNAHLWSCGEFPEQGNRRENYATHFLGVTWDEFWFTDRMD